MKDRFPLLAVVIPALAALPLLWCGDAPWINDEPNIIHMALTALRTGTVASHSMVGSRGIPMGPLPIWIYALLLSLTRDLVQLVFLGALISSTGCALAIAWMARERRGPLPLFAAAALLSPYLWFNHRLLWGGFYFPLSAAATVSYLSFCRSRRPWKLWVAVVSGVLGMLNHLMCVPLLAAMAAHAFWAHRSWLRERAALVLGLAGATLMLAGGYAAAVFSFPGAASTFSGQSPWQGWIFPLSGGRLFSAWGLDYFFGAGWNQGALLRLAAAISVLAVPLMWIGMAAAAARVVKGFAGAAPRDERFHWNLLGLATIACQCLYYGALRIYGHPHYLAPAWIFYFHFFWTGLEQFDGLGFPEAAPRFFAGAYAAAMAGVLAFIVIDIHARGGSRSIRYGPTLENQIKIARELNAYRPDSPITTRLPSYVHFPQALNTIVELYGLGGLNAGPYRKLSLDYASGDARSGRVELSLSN